jgi:hypothetical protein
MNSNYLNLVSGDELRKISSALCVKRISQRQRRYICRAHFLQLTNQWRVWPQRGIDIMPAQGKPVREVRKVALTAAKGLG